MKIKAIVNISCVNNLNTFAGPSYILFIILRSRGRLVDVTSKKAFGLHGLLILCIFQVIKHAVLGGGGGLSFAFEKNTVNLLKLNYSSKKSVCLSCYISL